MRPAKDDPDSRRAQKRRQRRVKTRRALDRALSRTKIVASDLPAATMGHVADAIATAGDVSVRCVGPPWRRTDGVVRRRAFGIGDGVGWVVRHGRLLVVAFRRTLSLAQIVARQVSLLALGI